jgi:hypothetical protein
MAPDGRSHAGARGAGPVGGPLPVPGASAGGPGIGPRGENLLFLVSQPRAGSTLLQRMLATHPDKSAVRRRGMAGAGARALRQAVGAAGREPAG